MENNEFHLEGNPHPDMEIPEHTSITKEQREEAHRIIQEGYTDEDRIENPMIDIHPASGKICLSLNVNKGNVGSNSLEQIYPLN